MLYILRIDCISLSTPPKQKTNLCSGQISSPSGSNREATHLKASCGYFDLAPVAARIKIKADTLRVLKRRKIFLGIFIFGGTGRYKNTQQRHAALESRRRKQINHFYSYKILEAFLYYKF